MVHAITHPMEFIGFYRFWAFEYSRRNSEYIELREQHSERVIELMEDRWGEYNEKMRRYEIFSPPEGYQVISSQKILENIISGVKIIRPAGVGAKTAVQVLRRPFDPKFSRKMKIDGQTIAGFDLIVAVNFEHDQRVIDAEMKALRELYYRDESHTEFDAQEYERLRMEERVKRIKHKLGASFDHTNDAPRAVGLWLWDQVYGEEGVEPERGAIKQAVERLRDEFDVAKLGYAASELGVFRKLLSRTRKCIEAAEVLGLN